ncbi:phage tail protein [Pectobacterium aroidearum]|uniref:phage tail protein n=1 Tax=Pectobacterium aroidearum TaxID=1201031 RepID=UPI0015DD80A3|nr:phage tail protein [Pectobacterium aroidearum]MBA0204378.1 phage tail protein [Pectobacterium aroidearum]
MSTKYFVLLTNIGAAKLANATVLGSHLDITHMAVGDGGGTLPTPNPAQTTLINEKRRAGINTLSVDPVNTNQIIAEQVIPESEGGFWIREIGLFDVDGDLVAIGNCAETYKPLLQEGSGRIQTVRMILIVSSTDAVTLKIDPAVVLATRGYVDDVIAAHEKSRKHPDGTLNAKGFVQLSSATTSDSELLAATPKAVKAVNDNANSRVPSGRTVNGKALSADIALIAGDVGAYTKAETDTRVATATTAANNAATAAANANTNANGRVPSGRTVNGKALSADITLNAGDVGAYTKAETDTRVATATTAANNAATAATNANTNANGRVPAGRTVNGKALSADIALNAGDVGAYTKAETDTRVAAATTAANNAATAAANANTNANGRVPSGRTINGKALSADIALNAGDVGALPIAGTAAAAAKLATPRKINGVAFDGTTDINLPSDFPVGVPIPYPSATPPTGWIKCNGQSFNKTTYPKLAGAYPSGILPDLRGEFIRGWDDGRGADAGRALLSQQGDAIRNITGEFQVVDMQNYLPSGAFLHSTRNGAGLSGNFVGVYHSNVTFDASRAVPTANENRPRNIAFNYIVRAA